MLGTIFESKVNIFLGNYSHVFFNVSCVGKEGSVTKLCVCVCVFNE